MKKLYIVTERSGYYKAISVISTPFGGANKHQSFWQNNAKMYSANLEKHKSFYKFLYSEQYDLNRQKLLLSANIYAHILFKKGLV